MSIPISSTVLTWKNSDARSDPLIYLYEVEVSQAVTLRLVAGDPIGGAVTYNGNTYTPAAIAREAIEQSIDGEQGSFRLAVSNIDGIAGGYIEREDLDGKTVRCITVPRSTLSPTDAMVETYSILDQSYNREVAEFVLGPPTFWRRRIPWQKFIRQRCQHSWQNRFLDGNKCGFPSDRFGADSGQDIRIGATSNDEEVKLHGWTVVNALRATLIDVDRTVPGSLYIETEEDDCDWSTVSRLAPFLFKRLSGDFDVFTEAEIYYSRPGLLCGLLCQEDGGDDNSWILAGRAVSAIGEITIRASSALDGVPEDQLSVADSTSSFIRLSRAGDVFTVKHSADRTTWTTLGTVTLTGMGSAVRLGLVASAPAIETGKIGVGFPEIQFRAGGPSTCDRTYEQCLSYGNLRRHFAFRGIPRA